MIAGGTPPAATDPGDDTMKRFILSAALLASGLAGLAQAADKADDAQLRAAVSGSHRSSTNAARDNWRPP
jgi:hypothetical protein